MYDLGKSGDDTNEPAAKTIVLQHKEDTYKTASKEIKKIFFSKPTALKPHCWYLIKVCIHGPSSDAGGDGKRMVTGDDGVKFTFMNSKTSNNGTDTRSGQIPLIIYRLANAEDDKDTDGRSEDKKDVASVHMIKKDFAGTVTEVCTCVYLSICLYMYVYDFLCSSIYCLHMCASVCVYMCVCACVCMCMCLVCVST